MTIGDRLGVAAQPEVGLGSEADSERLVPAAARTEGTDGGEASEEAPEKPWQEAEPPENLTDEPTGETGELSAPGSPRQVAPGGVNTALDVSAQVVDDPIRIYLQEISRVKLLSARDEVELAIAIERGAEATRQIGLLAVANPELRRQLAATVECGEVARRRLTEANLRLVISIARRYLNRGVALLDLFQEGNLGLLRAVEKFDYTLGYKFSTYATWWIRQAISRAVADQARTVRLPVHVGESLGKVSRASRRLVQELGREPTAEEIGAELGLTAVKVEWILKSAQETLSLEMPVGDGEEAKLGDFVEDRVTEAPAVTVDRALLREQVADVLGSLPARERRVLELRFGIEDGSAHTLEEVGGKLGVSRERIRQIEAKALRRLRHPSRSRWLREYAE